MNIVRARRFHERMRAGRALPMRRPLLTAMLALSACGLPMANDDAGLAPREEDGGAPDAGVLDAGVLDAGVPDAGVHAGWARYTISLGAHAATIAPNGSSTSP